MIILRKDLVSMFAGNHPHPDNIFIEGLDEERFETQSTKKSRKMRNREEEHLRKIFAASGNETGIFPFWKRSYRNFFKEQLRAEVKEIVRQVNTAQPSFD